MVFRFENVMIDSNIVALKKAAENVNTWGDENAVDKNPLKLLPEELNKVLEQFYASICPLERERQFFVNYTGQRIV